MPLGKGVRFRFKRTGGGKAVRLAFRGNKVVEAKPFKKRGGKFVKDQNSLGNTGGLTERPLAKLNVIHTGV